MAEPGVLVAFAGGLLALLSPCSAMLLPAFFAYSFTARDSGHTSGHGAGRTRLLGRTALFYLGLCLTLVPLGVAGSFAGRLFYGHRETLVTVGGSVLIALGVAQLLGVGFGSRRLQRAAAARRSGSALSVLALGAVYGLAGFCAGPILGSVLTVAALDGNPGRGGALLAVYALGMAVPLFVLAALWDRYDLGRRGWLRGRVVRVGRVRLHTTALVGGVLFILLGVVFLAFDGTAALPSPVSVETEFAWEQRLSRWAGAVPDRALLLGLCAVAAAAAVAVLLRTAPGRRREPHPPAERADSDRPADTDGETDSDQAADTDEAAADRS